MTSTVIAVDGIPFKWAMADTMKKLAKVLMVNFVTLGYGKPSESFMSKKSKNVRNIFRTIYLRLPLGHDPYVLIHKLNRTGLQHGLNKFQVTAYVTTEIPDSVQKTKPKQLPPQLKRFLQIREELPPQQTLVASYREILVEMQSKFVELYNLSNKVSHKLLYKIGEVVYSRLSDIMDKSQKLNCFTLTKAYRKMHPHFCDFELILNSYRQIVPNGDINEVELTTLHSHPYSINNVPFDKIQAVCNKYSDKIVAKVNAHLKALKTDFDIETDSEEDIAKKKVRAELKKLCPYMSAIVRQVVTENFIPRKSPNHKVRIYGEPYLPVKESLQVLLKRHHAVRVLRSEKMYNLLLFNIPPEQYSKVIALDGTLINNAKLTVRSSDMPVYVPIIDKGVNMSDRAEDETFETDYMDADEGEEALDY